MSSNVRNNNNNNEIEEEDEETEPPKPSCGERARAKLHAFNEYMWNSERKEFMGRTFTSWLGLAAFYIAFYAILTGFWAACLAGFLRTTIDYAMPTQQGNFSMLKANPGMTFEPFPHSNDTTLISYRMSNGTTYEEYTKRLTDVVLKPYLEAYDNMVVYHNQTKNSAFCDYDGPSSARGYACVFDTSKIPHECSPENGYGYWNATPCLFFRPNNIFGFKPIPYGNITAQTLREKPPPPAWLLSAYNPQHITITCEGENDGDNDNILEITYYPTHGFPYYYYPYFNQPGYLPPFVMVRFRVIPGRVIMIWCRLWALNIKHDRNDAQGSTHFELFVDK